jgi:hypothetical protein
MTVEYNYDECIKMLKLRESGIISYDEEVYDDMEDYVEQIQKQKEEEDNISIKDVQKNIKIEIDKVDKVKVKTPKANKNKTEEITDVDCANTYIKNFGLDNVKLTSQIPVSVYIWDEMLKLWINGNNLL